MTYAPYRYALSLTSQFYFCGLPLRLDPYGACLFSCQYCFASARGGLRQPKGLQVADPQLIERRLRGKVGGPTSVLDEFVSARQPIHLGGMADPFPPMEAELRVTQQLLGVLTDLQYPTVISTKGTLVATGEYLDLLVKGQYVVQVSFSTRSDSVAATIEVGVPSPSARLHAIRELVDAGVPTTVRMQPLIPGRETEALEFAEELASIGVRHIGLEFLKLPLEDWSGTQRLSKGAGFDLPTFYASAGSTRVGREWVLPVESRLPFVVQMRNLVHGLGISFGAADTDLLPLSDSACCCSGVDQLLPDAKAFSHNYLGAVRANKEGRISISALEGSWVPDGSISTMVNSRSRLPRVGLRGAGVRDYISANWNGRSNGCSPEMFYGVEVTEEEDPEGMAIYRITEDLAALLRNRR